MTSRSSGADQSEGVLDVMVSNVRQIVERRPYRAGVVVAVVAALILVYGVLALGLVGREGDPFDRIYAGVLAIGVIGAVLARFRAEGMALAMFATASAQAVVTVIALAAGKHESPVTSIPELVGLNGMFIVMFAVSGVLFRSAARNRPPTSAT